MPPQLTVGSFKPTGQPGPQYGGQYQYPQVKAPSYTGQPGSQYGGDYMHPPIPSGYTTQGPQAAPPVVPGVTAPGATGGAFGSMPDFSSMIGGSWEVASAESMMAAQMKAARTAFQTDLRSAFIDLGYEGAQDKASGLSDFSKYIDKDTIQKAAENKYSAYANIKKQEAETNAMNDAMLAARGGTTSGTATATATDTIGQVEQARYEGLRNFLGQGRAGLSNLTSMSNQLAQGVAAARFAAAQRLASEYAYAHPYQPPGMGGQVDTGAPPPPNQYGVGVPDYGPYPVSGGTGFNQTVTWPGQGNTSPYWWMK